MDPKSKPRKGQTQEENETEFEQALELKGLDMDSPEDLGVTITHGYQGTPLTGPTYAGSNVTSLHHAPTFMDFDDSVVVNFRHGEAEHKALRDRYPALEKAYDHYCTLLALAQNGPEDLDN